MLNKPSYLLWVAVLLIGSSIFLGIEQYPAFANNNNVDAESKYGISGDIKSQLDSSDRDTVRLAIHSLGKNSSNRVTELFKNLWNGESTEMFLHPESFNDPVVRLELAKELISRGESDEGKYVSFIKSNAYSRDWIIRSNAADGLAAVDDKEAVDLLYEIALTPHQQVALRAVWALERIAIEGNSSNLAIEAINQLLVSSDIDDEQIKEALRNAQNKISKKRVTGSSTDKDFIPYDGKELPPQSESELLRRANEGDPESQYMLGEMYLVGVGTQPDYGKAKKWLQLAVSQDFAPAKASLAQMYLSGRGVEKDRVKAMSLLKEAKAQGYQPAADLLGLMNNN